LVHLAANDCSEPTLTDAATPRRSAIILLTTSFGQILLVRGKTAATFDQQNGHFPETGEFHFPGLWPN
jgi:hypothetical protein